MTVFQIAFLAIPLMAPLMTVTAVPTAATIAAINAEGRAIDDLAMAIPSLQDLPSNIHSNNTSFFSHISSKSSPTLSDAIYAFTNAIN